MELQYPALFRSPVGSHPLVIYVHDNASTAAEVEWLAADLPEEWGVLSFGKNEETEPEDWFHFKTYHTTTQHQLDIPAGQQRVETLMHDIQKIKTAFPDCPLYLIGKGTGGMLVYGLSFRFPELYSKVAILSAYPEKNLMNQSLPKTSSFSGLKFFISHGLWDRRIPISWARGAADFLYRSGVYFTFREYDAGTEINLKNRLDLIAFLKDEAYPTHIEPQ